MGPHKVYLGTGPTPEEERAVLAFTVAVRCTAHAVVYTLSSPSWEGSLTPTRGRKAPYQPGVGGLGSEEE